MDEKPVEQKPDTTVNTKPKSQFLVIKIPKPKNLERMGWIFITLVLAVVAFYQPLAGSVTCGADFVTANWFGAEETAGQVVTEIEEPVVEEPEPVVVEEPEPVVEEEEEEEKPLSGLIEFEITKVNTVKKADDWGKILSVEYKINNEKKAFYPLIKVYAYDENDDTTLKNTDKGIKESERPVEAGEVYEGTIILRDGSFDGLDIPKTVTLQLFDQASEKLYKSVTTIITIK